MANVTKDLKRVRELLQNPKHWIKGVMFADRFGEATKRTEAVQMCLIGAMYKAIEGRATQDKRDRFDAMDKALDISILSKFNDDPETRHDDVLKALDVAITNSGDR